MHYCSVSLRCVIVFMSVFFLAGCEDKEVKVFLNTFFKDHIAQKEIGRCKNEPGTLVKPYHPWFLTRIADAIFVIPKQEGSPIENCIPDLDPQVVANLTAEEKAKNRADFVNALKKYLIVKRFKKESGQSITITKTFLELQELVRRGEELAQIELNLKDYYSNEIKFYQFKEDNKHYQRLKALADNGDGDAMCLYALRYPTPFEGYKGIANGGNFKKWYQEGPEDKSAKGLVKAAKQGGLACMVGYAYMLSETEPESMSVPYNPKLGFEYLKRAAIKGSNSAAWILSYTYSLADNDYKIKFNLGKSLCWAKIHNNSYPEQPISLSLILRQAKKYGKNMQNYQKFEPKTFCEEELM